MESECVNDDVLLTSSKKEPSLEFHWNSGQMSPEVQNRGVSIAGPQEDWSPLIFVIKKQKYQKIVSVASYECELNSIVYISGFQELNQDDQIKLIKQGSFEVVLARYTPLFQEDGMFIPTMEAKVPRYVHNTSIPSRGIPLSSRRMVCSYPRWKLKYPGTFTIHPYPREVYPFSSMEAKVPKCV